MKIPNIHTFHIPVMGLAYTIDTPIRVAHYGISSVISVMDDELIEQMNRLYTKKFQLPYKEISKKAEDFRAQRITSYLNTLDTIVKQKFEHLKDQLIKNKEVVKNYIDLLPNTSEIRENLQKHLEGSEPLTKLKAFLDQHLTPGSIDVNIMTKVDRETYENKEPRPAIYNDAHSALRGFAESTVNASVVLSAGMNPRLFGYFESFDAFFPDEQNQLQKKIILKVSDYRSAFIQGSFLAKKGLWVSEYRIESGLNCGGHAFATDGFLMGTILEEFKQKREELTLSMHELFCKALDQKGRHVPQQPLNIKITAQGGVGTALEHDFLLAHYQLDAVGWGSPFLLVPEATSTDEATRNLLALAKEDDLYLSTISPLGIPFNNIKGTTNEFIKQERIANNKEGSSCPRKYLALNKKYSEEGLCTASRKYQQKALAELSDLNLSAEDYKQHFAEITEKACLCVGLANAALMDHELPVKGEQQGVVICPGPNIAYFNKETSLKQMVNHIYGRENIIDVEDRPHVFIKELKMYLNHYKKEQKIAKIEQSDLKMKKQEKFRKNLLDGIAYYKDLFKNDTFYFTNETNLIITQLQVAESELNM